MNDAELVADAIRRVVEHLKRQPHDTPLEQALKLVADEITEAVVEKRK